MPALSLAAQLAGGEGRRTLPYFQAEAVVQTSEARIALDPALVADELPADVKLSFAGGSYALSVAREGEHVLRVRRSVALPPLSLRADQYADFSAFCSHVDEAEAGRLRLHRVAVDPSAGGR